MDISSVLRQMLILFIAIGVGYAGYRIKILDRSCSKVLANIVIHISLPAMVLASSAAKVHHINVSDIAGILGVSCLLYICTGLHAYILPKLLHVQKQDEGLFRFLTAFSNTGFIGFPVISAIYGADAIFYASIFNLPFNILVYSFGIFVIAGGKTNSKLSWRIFMNPCLAVSILGILINLFGIKIPDLIVDSCSLVGQMTTPAAMLVTGITLASIAIKDVFSDIRLYILSVSKLFVVPMLIWLLFSLFINNQLLLGIAVITAALPAATNSTLLCAEYGGNMGLAARGVFITTLAAFFTIPVIVLFLR